MHVINLQFIIVSTNLFCTVRTLFSDNIVVTPLGKIEGTLVYHNGIPVKTYLGIPYAKPPLRELRFKKPLDVEPWNTTLQAKQYPPGCVQYASDPVPWLDTPPGLTKDCLYLNIFAPVTTAPIVGTKKSVMFWIHGGGFSKSSSRVDFYHSQVLAAEGDVIVVTINYRLGAEGFFYSGTQDAPGNMGMWDMVTALKFVRDNIECFGGDKDSITLFGWSAGGIANGMFTVSPATRGLFKRAILQSGSPTNLDGEDNGKSFRTSEKLAQAVGCATEEFTLKEHPETVVECMRNKNAFNLAVTLTQITSGSRVYYPRYGDEFLPRNPRQAISEGDFYPVDVLVGSNRGDGALILTAANKDIFGFFGEKDPKINLTLGASILRDMLKEYPDPEAVVKLYLGGLEENDYYKIRFQVFTAVGDYKRICPSVYFTESFSKKKVNAYYYFFTHIPSNTPWAPWMLAVHHDETPFIFGYPLRYPQNYTRAEQVFSKRLIQTWSSFAKTGNPTAGIWLQYSKEDPTFTFLHIGPNLIGKGPDSDKCDFFRRTFGF